MVQDITERGASASDAAASHGVSAVTARKWLGRYRPQTNGKAERFIQSALREWAYGHIYANSDQRRAALPVWNHFYNWHRPHHGINFAAPVSRLARSIGARLQHRTYRT